MKLHCYVTAYAQPRCACAVCSLLHLTPPTHDPYPWTYLTILTMCMDGWTENTQVIAVTLHLRLVVRVNDLL